MTKTWKLGGIGAAFAAGLMMQAPAQAAEYTFSVFLPPDHSQTLFALNPWADAIRTRTNGEIDMKIYPGGAILPAVGVLKGLQEGVVNAAFVTAGYVPAEMPIWNVIGDLGWVEPDDMVIAFAATEYGFFDPIGSRDWTSNNVVYGGTTSTAPYYYQCKGKPQNLADFKGLRIRTPGNAWTRFAEHIGAIPVNVPSSEAYAAMERGAIDCATFDLTSLSEGTRIGEVVDTVIMLKMGPFFTQSTWTFNKDFWKGLTTEQRDIILDANNRSIIQYHIAQNDILVARNVETSKTKLGLEFIEPGADLQTALNEFVAGGLGGLEKIAADRNIPDYKAGLDNFTALVVKWKGLMEGVNRSDEEALYQLLKTEIYDKIDPATYGMN